MQLGKKKEFNQKSNEGDFKKSEPLDTTMFQVDFEGALQYGKYKDQTLRWVKEHDNNYYTWMLQENMIVAWGLFKLKEQPSIVTKVPHFITEDGEVWIGLKMIDNVRGRPSPFL